MRHLDRWMLFISVAALAACADEGVLEPQPDASFSVSGRGARHVTVMTRNMYIGADVDAAMAALADSNPGNDLPALRAALETLQRTDFAARVQAMAAIAASTSIPMYMFRVITVTWCAPLPDTENEASDCGSSVPSSAHAAKAVATTKSSRRLR